MIKPTHFPKLMSFRDKKKNAAHPVFFFFLFVLCILTGQTKSRKSLLFIDMTADSCQGAGRSAFTNISEHSLTGLLTAGSMTASFPWRGPWDEIASNVTSMSWRQCVEPKLAKAVLTFFSLLSGSKLFHLTLFLRFNLNVKTFLGKEVLRECAFL